MSKKPSLRQHLRFERSELPALFGVLGVVAFLHIAGWGLFIHFNSDPQYQSLTDSKGVLVYAGAGALAYSFGLRHAFDADHIAAIDDKTTSGWPLLLAGPFNNRDGIVRWRCLCRQAGN
jgi:high-affinity nickel-transport protein